MAGGAQPRGALSRADGSRAPRRSCPAPSPAGGRSERGCDAPRPRLAPAPAPARPQQCPAPAGGGRSSPAAGALLPAPPAPAAPSPAARPPRVTFGPEPLGAGARTLRTTRKSPRPSILRLKFTGVTAASSPLPPAHARTYINYLQNCNRWAH